MAKEINIIFISLNILIFINSIIQNNPIKTDNYKNPLDFYILVYINNVETFSPGNQELKIFEEINQIKFDGKSYIYSPNIFLCMNQVNEEFLYVDYNLYTIIKNSNGITSASIYRSIPHNGTYFGYLKKENFVSYENPEHPTIYSNNNFNNLNDNEIILYGVNNNSVIFYFSSVDKVYEISFDEPIKTISCKFLDFSYFCVFEQYNKIYGKILNKGNNQKLIEQDP